MCHDALCFCGPRLQRNQPGWGHWPGIKVYLSFNNVLGVNEYFSHWGWKHLQAFPHALAYLTQDPPQPPKKLLSPSVVANKLSPSSSTFPLPLPHPGILIGSLNFPDSLILFLREGRLDHSVSRSKALKAYTSLCTSFQSVLVDWVDLVHARQMLVEVGGGVYHLHFRGLLSTCGRWSSTGDKVLSQTGLVCKYIGF